ncbi:T9SS type B sorting domain-containing protein [Flavobacterium sp. N1994]|uniref:T9SS type B sorting domain-containing protein n=1 Tax=Flavobacterium sp. N1994 TaxID=2986827 RepID=UPI0022226033|nr:T9SS type B sorting domain-containing protein [Flavobacterium sp. N1994]
MVRPPGTVNTPPNGLIYNSSQEYIELYNSGCLPINVSGYFIAMKQTIGTINTGGTIRIPNVAAAIIPSGGHIVLASANPAGAAVGNVDIPLAAADYCFYNGNFVLANTDGWCALYNAAGVAIDCVYWSSSAANLTSNTSDYNTGPLCLPTGSPAVTLQTPFQLNTSNPSIIKYGGANPAAGSPLSRQQDGSSTWVQNLATSINSISATGHCNGGTCVTPSLPAAPVVTTPINYCQGATASALSATALTGGTLNWYGTNATGGTASATAPTPSTTTVGPTTYYVSQTIGGCESLRSAIVVNVNASSSSVVSCGIPTTTSVTFNWTAATGATGYTISYQVNALTPVNVGAVANTPTSYTVGSLNSGDSVTITVTPTGAAPTCFTSTTFSCATLVNNACGACATPTCPIVGVSSYANLNFSAGSCNTWTPQATNTTLTNYYLATSDASGFLGIAQQATSSPGLCIVRSAVIRPLATSCNVASSISPSATNANSVASGFNPEWYGLTPNTQYIVVETVVLSATCSLTSLCTNYYGCTTPATPTASVTVQPTCSTPTGTIVVSAPVGAGNLYSIDGVTYQASTTFTGLSPNNYTVTVKKTPTGCVSGGTILTVNAVPTITAPTASATVQPTCTTPTGTIVVTAPTGANLEYSVNGVTYQSSTTFTGLAPNNYNVTVRNTSNGCVSTATVVTINAVPTIATPTASATVQPSCATPTGTIVVTAPTGANLEYSVNGTTYQASATFTGLTPNNYNVTVRNTINGCVSTATIVAINAVPTIAVPTASATVQPTCAIPTGTIVVTAPTGANLEYSVNGTTYQTSVTFTGLATNNYNVTVRNTTNGCVSAATIVTINAVPTIAAPSASATVQPTCTTPTGTIVVSAPTGANYQYSINGVTYQASITFTGLAPNTYNVTVRNTTNSCASIPTIVTINAIPTIATPTASATVQPTCTTPTGTIVVTAPTGANLEYSINGTTYQTSTTFTGLTPNNYNVTVRNTTNGCVSTATIVAINAIPTIATPTASATVQPTCTTPTGTIVVSAPTGANLEYSVNGTTYQTSTTFTGLTPNNYNVTVRNTTNGCVSTATIVTVNAIPTLATPTASVTVQPTCTTPTGTIVVTAPTGANLEYSVNGTTYQTSTTFIGLTPNNYNVTVRNTSNGCVSLATPLTVNPIPSVAVPTVTTQQPDCTVLTGAIQVTSPLGTTLEYSNNGVSFQLTTGFLNLSPNNYVVTVRNTINGCTSSTAPIIIANSVNDVVVNPNPLPLQDCDPNNDGFVTFDLTQIINSITGGNPNYTVTFHETPDDALINGTTIPNPLIYDNINPFVQTIYVRVDSNTTTCYQIVPLQLIVNKTPVPTQPTPYALCDYTGAVGFETFDLTTKINEILGSINPALTSVSFYTSQPDADAGTNAITSISSYVNASPNTQTLYVRVETIATGCYDVVTLQLVVNPIPNSLQPNYPQYSLCDVDQSNIGFETFDLGSKINDILLGQTGMTVRFYISLGDAQNGTNEITNLLYQNQIQYVQTLGISITNNATGCSVISTMDIRVEPLPSLIPPTQPYTLCDDDQDGFTTFDLTSLLPGLLNSITTYTVSFHETPQDAASNGTTIPNPAQYININPFVQIIYARAEDNLTHCVSVIPIELDVNPSPKTPVSLVDITVCDTDNNPQDASTRVDLTQLTASVLSQQPLPATAYSVTYYTSLAIAQVGTAPIIPDTNYVGSNGQTIWVRVENNVTHCYNIGTFLLHINTPLLLTTPTPLSLCDDDANPNNQYHTFDLTVKNAQITQGLLGYTVTYYPSLLEAQTHTNPITTPTAYQNDLLHPAVQTLGVVVSSPAPANCESITTLDIRVLPIPTPNTNPAALAPKCDDNNPGDMLEYFDLTVNESYIRNNDPNLSFHYFPTQADAENNIVANEILTPTNALVGTNVWIRVENTRVDYQGNHCYVLVEQALKVNPLPTVVQPLAPYRVCDNDTDGLAPFDLTNPLLAPQILGAAQATTDFTISYYLTAAGANPLTNTGQLPLVSPYTNVTANSQNIYIRVVNNTTGCTNTGVLTLAVEQYATATGPQTFAECDNYNDPYDGIHQIDLTQYATAILNGQSPTVFLVSYYTSLADATAGTNALTLAQAQAYQTDPDTDTIWVKVENSSNTITPLCYAITTIDITVERYPNPIIVTDNGVNTICVNFDTNAVVRPLTLDSGIANPGNYTFEWFEDAATTPITGATGPTYTVNTSSATGATRNYTVHVTSNSALACDTTSASFAVIQSGQASIPTGTIGYTVTNAFTEQQIITVLIQGYGTYEYSLDDGPRQASTIFDSVSLGTHVIHVWDTEGGIAYSCEELIIEDVQIIDYPHYFTPNGDGIHDTWNIVGLGGQPDARIYIFDRYGKLLKQISSAGNGWDGTYNGHLLPSDDYWFSVDYIENASAKQFKAHFSLKR